MDRGANVEAVSRPVFSSRPKLDDPIHKRGWEILQCVLAGQKNSFLDHVILQSQNARYLVDLIRQTFREELQSMHLSLSEKAGEAAGELEDGENAEFGLGAEMQTEEPACDGLSETPVV